MLMFRKSYSEPLPDFGPLCWRFSGMFAHGGLMADEQFTSVAGASLPIALCGLTSL